MNLEGTCTSFALRIHPHICSASCWFLYLAAVRGHTAFLFCPHPHALSIWLSGVDHCPNNENRVGSTEISWSQRTRQRVRAITRALENGQN